MPAARTDVTIESLGLTLAEYAAARRVPPRAARDAYTRLMREGADGTVPAPSRVEEDHGIVKFCLPVDDRDPAVLETESVLIPMHSYRGSAWYTLCLSSQVGCRMGCTFCETGRMGLRRQLSAAEIVVQQLAAARLLHARGHQTGIRNLVFMGMGEPFDNFDAVAQAVRVFTEPHGLAYAHSQITISTAGRIDGLRALAALGWPNLRLAISLNAADDARRTALMPLNQGMPLAALQGALLDYPLGRRGRFLIEYVLLAGVNDAPADADRLVAWCRPLPCTVNLIPYNPQRAAPYAAPDEAAVVAFLARLRAAGVFAKRRASHGRTLMGGCGQLGNPAR